LPAEALAEANLAPEQRASIQQQLIDAGFLTGPADGEFGPVTREAMKQHQISLGESPTGFYSPRTANSRQPGRPAAPEQTASNIRDSSRTAPAGVDKPMQEQQAEASLRNRVAQLEAQQEALRQQHIWELERERNARRQAEARIGPSTGSNPVSVAVERSQPPQVTQAVPTRVATASLHQQSSDSTFGAAVALLLILTGIIGATILYAIRIISDGRKLKLLQSKVFAFGPNDEPLLTFNNDPEAYLSENGIEIRSQSASHTVRYSLATDVRCLDVLDERKKVALGKTAARMAFTGFAWSMIRSRRGSNVGLGSALLDYRYFGSSHNKVAEIHIVFLDMSSITIECAEKQATSILRGVSESAFSAQEIKEAKKEHELLRRMLKDGPRVIPELQADIAKLKEQIRIQQDKSENAETFSQRDQARQELQTLKQQIAFPRAALFRLSSHPSIAKAA
jgi:peptidoglycan hydrolase-like protein with peptidoglycan-binding domain